MTTISTTTLPLATGTWTADPSHTTVGFVVRHLGLSKVRGRFDGVTAQLVVGDDLAGKLHVTVGDMDTYYLNNAVELMEVAMEDLDNPAPEVSFEYGRRKPHCWIGASPWRPGEDLNNGEFLRVVDEYLKRKGQIW